MSTASESTRFRLLGEPLALELANTVPGRHAGSPDDLLAGPSDAVAWLVAEGFSDPEDPDLAFSELISLRNGVRDTADALIAKRRPSADSLHTLNQVAARRPTTPIIRYRKGRLEVIENPWGTALDHALGRIGRDAVRLFGAPQGARIKQCEGPGCLLLFVAGSPRRRWCSSQLCGNRVRVARHYEKTRGTRGVDPDSR